MTAVEKELMIQPLPWWASAHDDGRDLWAVIDAQGIPVFVGVTQDEAEFIVKAVNTAKPLNNRERHKGTGDVLKDLAYAQKYMDGYCEGVGTTHRITNDMRFVERALRVATAEIKLLRGQVATLKSKRSGLSVSGREESK